MARRRNKVIRKEEPDRTPPKQGPCESIKEKIILLCVQALIVPFMGFLLTLPYNRIKKTDAVKWEMVQQSYDTSKNGTGRVEKTFRIYRFGDSAIKDLFVYYDIKRKPEGVFKLVDASLNRYDRNFLNLLWTPPKSKVAGSEVGLTVVDYVYKLQELSPSYIYELKVVIESKGKRHPEKHGALGMRNWDEEPIGDEGLSFYDQLNLYTDGLLVFGILLLLLVGIGVWKLTKYFIHRKTKKGYLILNTKVDV